MLAHIKTFVRHAEPSGDLHDLNAKLHDINVCGDDLVVEFVDRCLATVFRPQLDAMLDVRITRYTVLDMDLALKDDDASLENTDPSGHGGKPAPEIDRLSHILQAFNAIFADANFTDADRFAKQMAVPAMDALVGDTQLRQIAASTDDQNQRIAFDDALNTMVHANWTDHYELIRKLGEDPQFKDAFGSWMFRIWQNRIAAKS
jgi:hypothetical protein